MYFNLPKSEEEEEEKVLNKKSSFIDASSTSNISTTKPTAVMGGGMNSMTEDRITEIIHNLDDHWGSPPLLTPNTLTHILNHQWINNNNDNMEEVVSKSTVDTNVMYNLIKEFCNTIQKMDTENKFQVTKDLMHDSIIQKYLISSSTSVSIEGKEEEEQEDLNNVLGHMVELLQQY